MRVAVLTYHSQNVTGMQYGSNDHIALKLDLTALRTRGIRVISATSLAQALRDGADVERPAVVLTCDDGTLLDWEDYFHQEFGLQSSFRSIVSVEKALGLNAPMFGALTSFVIASPEARAAIDARNHAGQPLSAGAWWKTAADDRRITLGCHSWDHCAIGIPAAQLFSAQAGTFRAIDNFAHAEQQICAAGNFIRQQVGDDTQARLFAYPYGESTPYLVDDYFPSADHGMLGAFTDGAEFVTLATNRWAIPRFVCGAHWKSAAEFEALLSRLTA